MKPSPLLHLWEIKWSMVCTAVVNINEGSWKYTYCVTALLHIYTENQTVNHSPYSTATLYTHTDHNLYTLLTRHTNIHFWVLLSLHWEKYLSPHLLVMMFFCLVVYREVKWWNVVEDVSPGGIYPEKSWQPTDPFKTPLLLFSCMLIASAFLHSNYISISMETLTSKHVQKNNNQLMMSLSPQSRNIIRYIWCQETERWKREWEEDL